MDVSEFWDFSDPEKSETRFRDAVTETDDPTERAILLTQVARTFSLRRDFDRAMDVLNEIDQSLSPEVEVRWNLEKGRTANSSGDRDGARRFFEKATQVAVEAGLEFLAVDAVHMEAIVAPDPETAIALNERAIEMAADANDPKARGWQGSLLNNQGWSYHDLGRFDDALRIFEKTVTYFESIDKPDRARIGKWSVARTLRSLERFDEALSIQQTLLDAEGDPSGYTSQEIGWNLVALGRESEASAFFKTAIEKLEADDWYVANNADELEKMKAHT